MRSRTLIALVVLLLFAAFVAVNWSVFAAPAKVSFVVASADLPIGLVMLALLALLAVTFGSYAVVSWTAMTLEFRRQAKELNAQRTLADQAEASRLTELREFIHAELEQLANRLSKVHEEFRTEIHEASNSVAATIGELDDRIQRLNAGAAPK